MDTALRLVPSANGVQYGVQTMHYFRVGAVPTIYATSAQDGARRI